MSKVYVYRCPVCANTVRFGSAHEPCCTGPSSSRDEHEMTVMRLFRVADDNVNPVIAEQHARGPLILPAGYRP